VSVLETVSTTAEKERRSAESLDGAARAEGRDRVATWLLWTALALGLVRFLRLGAWSLWFDESATWTDIHVGLEGGEIHNPLGYWAIAATVKLLGGIPDEFALRFLPAVAGWCVIPLTWVVFRPFVGSRRAAAAALVLAASTWHVYWSQNARFYTMAQFISLLGCGIVLRGLFGGRIVPTLLGFGVAAVAALFHPSAALVLPALILAPWFVRWSAIGDARPAFKPALVLALLAIAGALSQIDWVIRTWETYQRQKSFGSPAHYLLTSGFYVTPLWATGALAGSWIAVRKRAGFPMFALVLVLLILAAALVMSVLARVSAQYVFVVLPWVVLLACLPLPAHDDQDRKRIWLGWCYLALLVAPALATTMLYMTTRKGERPQWRDAYEYVWNQRGSNDLVIGMEATVGEYYLAPLRTDLRQPVHVVWLDYWRTGLPEHWARHTRPIWIVFNPEQLYDWRPEDRARFLEMLARDCRLEKEFPLYVESRDLSVCVYRRD
jgi:hypothetical protein